MFIIDPWVWLMLAGGVVCGTRRFGRAKWLWYALTFAATCAVAEACRRAVVPWWVLAGWLTGVAEIAALRWWGRWRGACWIGWGLIGCYLVLAVAVNRHARLTIAPGRAGVPAAEMRRDFHAMPVPGVPWEREVIWEILRTDLRRHYSRPFYCSRRVRLAMGPDGLAFAREPAAAREHPIARPDAVAADLTDDPAAVAAWRSFARFPIVSTDWGLGSPDVVTLGDYRYALTGRGDWSAMVVPRRPQRHFWDRLTPSSD